MADKQTRMGKVIAGLNMTLDGFCDHTVMSPDEEIHRYYSDVLRQSDVVLYGRTTYQLMEYWKAVLEHPTGNEAMDDFAVAMDGVRKIVFSRTLTALDWKTAELAKADIQETVLALKRSVDGSILVGSPSLIVALTNMRLIDEYHLCVLPILVGAGLPLFKNIQDRVDLSLMKTRSFASGAVALYYKRSGKNSDT